MTTENGIKIEGGDDRIFETGAKRQAAAGKGLPSLLPPDALSEIAKHLEAAAAKYGSRNWEKGLPLASILDSLLRHIFAELMGDKSENHARAIGCNTLFYIATKLRIEQGILPASLNDLPEYNKTVDPQVGVTLTTLSPEVAQKVMDAQPGDVVELTPQAAIVPNPEDTICSIRAVKRSDYSDDRKKEIIGNILNVPEESKNGYDYKGGSIGGAFSWSATVQGHEYWSYIDAYLTNGGYYREA